MGNFDWLGFFTGLAAVLGVLGTIVTSWRAASKQQEAATVVKQEAAEAKEAIKAEADETAAVLKTETKKVADANVEVALLQGEKKGREDEQANPMIKATVPGETVLDKPLPKTKEVALTPARKAKLKAMSEKAKPKRKAKK